MKFIHTSDFHIWDKLRYSIDDSRIKKIEKNAMYIVDYAIENKIGYIFITGDVFNVYNPDEKSFKVFSRIVSHAIKNNIRIRVIAGDHDTDGINYSLESYRNLIRHYGNDLLKIVGCNKDKNVTIVNERIDYGFNIVYIPFQINIVRALKIARLKYMKDNINVLFSHCGINMAYASSRKRIKNKITEDMLEGWDIVCLGDYHLSQRIGKNIYYAGSIIRINWGERNDDKSFNVVKIGKDIKVNKVPLDDIEFIEVKIKYEDCIRFDNKTINEWKGKKVRDGFINIIVYGDIELENNIFVVKNAFYRGGAAKVYETIINSSNELIKSVDIKSDTNIDILSSCKEFLKNNLSSNLKKYYEHVENRIVSNI